MAKLDKNQRVFNISAPYSTSSYIGERKDIWNLITSKEFHYTPVIKELLGEKFKKLTKKEIIYFAKLERQRGGLSKVKYEKIIKLYK